MDCPRCNTANAEGLAFCGACGAPLAPGTVPEPPVAQPVVEPTSVLPVAGQPPAAAYAAPPAAAPQLPPGYGAAPAYGVAAPPPKKGGKAIVIVLLIVGLLLCCCVTAAGGGWLWFSQQDKKTDIGKVVEDGDGGGESEDADSGTSDSDDGEFSTADDAVMSVLPEPDWVYQLDSDDGDTRSYLVGPPQSEWAGTVIVGKQGSGWVVIDDGQGGGDSDSSGDLTIDEMKAYDTVKAFLGWVLQDDGAEAQKLTVEPFRNDSASAEISGGGLTDYVIEDVTTNSDGTYDVVVTETWYGDPETYTYKVKSTAAGYRIFDLSVQ